jgi:hypothetical protein
MLPGGFAFDPLLDDPQPTTEMPIPIRKEANKSLK